MASSGNFATWNPLSGTTQAATGYEALYEHGNTSFRGNNSGGNNCMSVSSLHMMSGKWYFEVYLDGSPAGGWPGIGIIRVEAGAINNITVGQQVSNHQNQNYTSTVFATHGNKNVFGQTSTASYGTAFSSTDIYNIAVDIDGGKIWWGKNNTYFNSGNPATGTNAGDTFTAGTEMALFVTVYNGASKCILNAGQNSSFAGHKSTGTQSAADGNGFGDFYYTPPSGFNSLCTANLPIDSGIDPAGDDGADENPTKQFNALTYTGNGTGQSITGVGFKPDLLWCKMSSSSQLNFLFDSSRFNDRGTPTPNYLSSDRNGAEVDDQTAGNTNPIIASFDNDGFTLGTSGSGPNDNTRTYCAWAWKANGGTTTTDGTGDISTVRQSNVAGGFAILTWTGNGSNNQRLPHGLGKKPAFVIAKRRDAAQSWGVWTQYLGANAKELQIDSASAQQNSSNAWYQDGMTTSFVGIGSDRNVSTSTNVAYVWADVDGFQKFGTYRANHNADGSFVYTGFRPRMVFVKFLTSTAEFYVFDSARDIENRVEGGLEWTTANLAEAHEVNTNLDFLANGFKIRGAGGGRINELTGDYMYGAWGDVPTKYGNAF